MSATTSQWTPPAGRHQVSMGKSMSRFLKQRKGIQQSGPSKALPSSSFYHFRYKFMPESVDTDKPGVLELTSKDVTTARVERACQQSDQVHTFRGHEEPAKEVDCVLIYDPESGAFTLEKLDSSLNLSYESRSAPKNRHPSASPLQTEPSPVASTPVAMSEDPLLEALEKKLEGELNDSDDEDINIPLSASSQIVADRRRQAVSQTPLPVAPVAALSKATGTVKAKSKLKGPAATEVADASMPTATKVPPQTKKVVAPIKPAPALSKAAQKPKAKGKAADPEEEVFDLGRSARPPVNSLALPTSSGSGGGLVLPGPTSSGSDFVSLPGGPPVSAQTQYEDDDDDEWDQVAGPGDSAPGPSAGTGADEDSMYGDHNFADTMEEIDINVDQFAAEMDQELQEGLEEVDVDDGQDGDDDDMFGDNDNDMEEVMPQATGKPMSISQFAAGAAQGEDDEDDYSSTSEDSDDD